MGESQKRIGENEISTFKFLYNTASLSVKVK